MAMEDPVTPPVNKAGRCPAHHHHLDGDVHEAHPMISNIESFVVSTVPLVPELPERERAAGVEGECSGVGGAVVGHGPHFALKDLWEFFDEWSAYGVEVPLLLEVEEQEVFQYYVPFLSGMQIFKATDEGGGGGGGGSSNHNVGGGVTGDAGGGNDDGEGEKQVKQSRAPSSAAATEGPEGAEGAEGAGAAAKSSDVTANAKKGLLSSGAAATRTGEEVPGRKLVFQFMEQSSPYSRAPLSDTLTSLAETEPALMTLTSDELHPASWLSIAWYPIYRIPVGRSLRDLSACFLTYHALSTAAGAERESGDDEKNAAGAGGGGDGEASADDAAMASGAAAAAAVGSTGASAGGGFAAVVSAEARSREWVAAGGCPAPPPVSAHGEAAMSTRTNRLRGADPASRPRMGLRWGGDRYTPILVGDPMMYPKASPLAPPG